MPFMVYPGGYSYRSKKRAEAVARTISKETKYGYTGKAYVAREPGDVEVSEFRKGKKVRSNPRTTAHSILTGKAIHAMVRRLPSGKIQLKIPLKALRRRTR